MKIIRAREEHLDAILEITQQAKKRLEKLGLDQWQQGYPAREDWEQDLRDQTAFAAVTKDPDGKDAVMGAFAFLTEQDPSYASIDGAWLTGDDARYASLHRACVADAYLGQGVGRRILRFGLERTMLLGIASLRIDTHPGNLPMQNALAREGFERCGDIILKGGPEDGHGRIAYEKMVRPDGFERLTGVVRALRAEDGCPWDRVQTHESLKPECLEEAAEVIQGINILQETGSPDSLKEELGDLLLQVMFHAQLAEEEGLFTIGDVMNCVSDKMVRRHPHVFGAALTDASGKAVREWSEIKKLEKAGREWESEYLPKALDEAQTLIDAARKRKGFTH